MVLLYPSEQENGGKKEKEGLGKPVNCTKFLILREGFVERNIWVREGKTGLREKWEKL